MNVQLVASDGLSKVTRKVILDFNFLTDTEFFNKYSGTKKKYLNRFIKYGDPYMNSPLAKLGKRLQTFKKK